MGYRGGVRNSFGRGAGFAVRGLRVLATTPVLWTLVMWPFLLALLAMVALGVGLFTWSDGLVAALTPGGFLGHLLGPVVRVIYWLVAPLLLWFAFLPVAGLIAGPFNEAIAEAVEVHVLGRAGEKTSLARLVRDLGLTVVHEARKFLRWVFLALGVLALATFVPGIGALIGWVGGGYLAARFAAWDALDYTLSRRGWSYAEKQAFLRARRATCLGLGGTIALLLLVPGVGALVMPAAAAAGALYVDDEIGPAPRPDGEGARPRGKAAA
jgi:CysZ protein